MYLKLLLGEVRVREGFAIFSFLEANMQRLNDAFDSGVNVFLFLAARETASAYRSPPVPRDISRVSKTFRQLLDTI